ncbi:uncharacterized protein LOC113495880 [Trichoplusia ni]|uniref:Uncharacterized protein LOC113495880 n=1 Tax=Trichoplusia ni TaxID=7111 RepID=A0A7E5VQR3_TRINI|nr:uncharacterized protein LOC113495880 [Trichoplusia ni]
MTSQADQMLSILEDTAALLKKTQTNLKKCPKERLSKAGYIQTRIETLEQYWNTFKQAHQDLLKCTTREQRGVLSYFVNEEFFIQEDLYLCMLGDLKDLLAAHHKKTSDHSKCTSQSAAQLKTLLDTTSEIINSLENLKVFTGSWDPIIVFLVVQKLDPESHKEWEQSACSVNPESLSTWKDLREFLESTFRTLELVNPTTSTRTTKERVLHVSTSSNDQKKSCALCKDTHTLCHCNAFNKMALNERREHVKTNKLCFNCLAAGHSVFKCRMPMSCRICKRRHHTLLHQPKNTNELASHVEPQQATSSQADAEEKIQAMVASHHISGQKIALLATAVVILKSENGYTTALKALIDSGSQACFISEKATQILKLNKYPVNLIVSGMESMKVRVKHEVEVQVLSRWEDNFNLPIKAYVMSKPLTSNINPSSVVTETDWPHLSSIQLADENCFASGTIDLLLGVNEYVAILKQGLIKGPPGTPCAQNTHLGWILMGGTTLNVNSRENSIQVMKQEVNIEDLLKTIWEIDVDSKRTPTLKEQLCENIYKKTHKRVKEGKYIVRLPFNTENPKSAEGNTREIAKRRFVHLERRFSQNKDLKQEYTKVIEEYKELKHMEEVPTKEMNSKSVYLPHHAVIRNDKETTKTRVVFDASCKGSNGISLNDELLVGPILQEDLRSIIVRWRMHAICFASDIQKMYRMVWIDREDADFQRILWRNDPSDDIKEYRLLTVTFGTASAPYLAIRTLMQLADDEGERFPEAARILREDFYVDDVMSGCDNLKEAVRISQDLKGLLKLGGFELKKWSSNSREFMETIDPNERSSNAHLKLNVDGVIKALGIQWNLGKDQFEYSLNLPPIGNVITKRSILSDIQRLFDPLGWIAPCLVMSKILIQQLWLEKVEWDEAVNPTLAEKWSTIRSDLENVNGICINRWMGTSSSNKDCIEIHGFSDASVQAYGAVVYCRVTYSDGSVKTSIVAARTRVAPLKTISLPRLELCGALLLSRLLKQIGKALRLPASQIYAWTDSSIVISWIFGDPNKWKTFIANRVVEITTNVKGSQWYHVKSDDNPADIASRGMTVANLKTCKLWWNGPDWLPQPKIQFTRPNILPTELERKKDTLQTLNMMHGENEEEKKLWTQFNDFDSLIQLLRTITYSRRFLKQKTYKEKINSPITTEELQLSLQTCIKKAQEEEFVDEINALKGKKTIKKSSKIKSLNPYLDNAGILRVGGRLRNADLDEESKHPVILGRNSRLTVLLVAEAHTKTLHGGTQLMLTYLRSKYWILRAKALAKRAMV